MDFTEKTVIRILLVVAKLIARDEWKKEIDSLSAHISCGDWSKKG